MAGRVGRPAGSKCIRVWWEGRYISPRALPTRERFLCYVEDTGDCWEWQGALSPKGYGAFSVKSVKVGAHRFAYQEFVGPIPEGLEIDHLCRNRACVNPDHLEPVTHKANVLRSPINPIAVGANRETCDEGHALQPFRDGRRRCFDCKPLKKTLEQRLDDSYEVSGSDCWTWTAEFAGAGYPRFFDGTRRVQATRFMYERFVGPIPDGWAFINECGDRSCVNPTHGVVLLDARYHPKAA